MSDRVFVRAIRAALLYAAFLTGAVRPAFAAGTFTVTTTADAGPGSLRQAIDDANAANGGTINVSTGGGLLSLASSLPILSTPITINGGGLLISGGNQYRIFFADPPATAAI